jgi:hypothetical protein
MYVTYSDVSLLSALLLPLPVRVLSHLPQLLPLRLKTKSLTSASAASPQGGVADLFAPAF